MERLSRSASLEAPPIIELSHPNATLKLKRVWVGLQKFSYPKLRSGPWRLVVCATRRTDSRLGFGLNRLTLTPKGTARRDIGGIFRSRRRRPDSRLGRSDHRLHLQFRLAGVRARHDVARPARARDQGRRGGDGLVSGSRALAQRQPDGCCPRTCLSVGGARGESCNIRERRMQLMGCEVAGNQDQGCSEHQS